MKKKLFIIIPYALLIILTFLLFSYKFEIGENGYNIYTTLEDSNNDNAIDIVKNNDLISQKITIKNNLKYLMLYFNVNDVIDDSGMYKLEIIDKDGNVAFSKEISYLETITESGSYKAKVKNLIEGEYTLNLRYNGNDTNFSPLVNKNIEENVYDVNGKQYEGALHTRLLYPNLIRNITFYIGFFIIVAIATIILYIVNVKKKEESLEKKFLYMAVPIYLLYLIFVPLYVAHDELFHWYRIFEITEGGLLPDIQDKATGYMMPSAVGSGLPWGDLRYIDIIREISDKLDYNDKTFISDVTMSVYSPIQYLPHVIGVIFGKIITNRPIIISYLGRLVNLAICIALLYFAIKKSPFGKRLIFAISFIPIAVEGFTSLSGDGFTISISMLFISYILEIFTSKRYLEIKDYVILAVLGIIIAFCKIVYIPIVFLLFIIPKESFGSNKKKYLILIPMVIGFVILNLTWLMLANPYLSVYTNGKSSYQIKYILTNPIRYCQTFLYTIQKNGIGYITSLFGDTMLWGNAVTNYTFVPIVLICLIAYICMKDNLKNKFKLKELLIIAAIVLCVVALMFTSLYVQWTRYASEKIDGVQGRYFLPIIFLVFLLIANFIGKENDESKKDIDKVLTICCIFASFMCLIELFVNYI